MNSSRAGARIVVLLVGVLGFVAVAEGKVVYVAQTGNDANEGLWWASAKRTVQAGLNAAVANDQVWVAAGTYVEQITLKAEVALYGGFAGTETDLTQRDWKSRQTILDGNAQGTVVTAATGAIASTRIDGFTIRNGKAASGGGVNCTSSAPTIENNTITGNTATSNGGGICCDSSSPTITNTTITGNSASFGGGVYCSSSSPTITNTTITGNSASRGGGIDCYVSSPTITNTIIAFNYSGVYSIGSTPSMRSSCVYGNKAYNFDGMMEDPTGTNGNISADPMLAAASYADFHILPSSPCRDAGDDSVVQADWKDMDGDGRIVGSHVDIGADESDGTVWPAGPFVIVCVSPEGNDGNDGSSWSSAKRTVQAAIDAAAARGGDVWVKAGTYAERIVLKSFAHVYGGFAGTETARQQRDWQANVSIFDGGAGGSVVTADRGGYLLTTIDGMTIRNGQADWAGGIDCESTSPTIENNTITANKASNYGGGVYCGSCSPVIRNNTITNNSAPQGGGILCWYSSSPVVMGNTINRNRATSSDGRGGGIYCYNRSTPTIANNTISGNAASGFGGGMYVEMSNPVIANNAIVGNSAPEGGGICFYSTVWVPTVVNNTIIANRASALGGGIYCHYSNPTITNTIVAFNSSGLYGTYSYPPMRFNNVYGNASRGFQGVDNRTGTDGNISADPLLVRSPSSGADGTWGTADDDYGDLRLQAGSPCIDAGDNGSVPVDIVTDLDGRSRFFDNPATADTGLGTPPIVDMGAYEYQPPLGVVSAVSVKTHGTAGDIGIDILAPEAVEPRAGGPTRLVVTFSAPIQALDGSFEAGDEVTLSSGIIAALTVAAAQLTIDLSGVPNATCLTIGLQGIAQVGGSVPMAPTALAVAVLLGDVNGDRYVNVLDLITVRNRISAPVAGDNFQCDVVASGGIDVLDLITVRNHNNTLVAETCPGFGQ